MVEHTALRLPTGGLIDRTDRLQFTFNGKTMSSYAGDTLASALLANGQRLVGRSFKYHRPRGIFTAGSEEPNALVQLRRGAHQEPNTRATTAELFNGLDATSQNHRGPLGFDVMAINDRLSAFLGAGFYYKTFMWPKAFWEKLYEPIIRSAAGLGRLSGESDPDTYDKGFLHCDLLIIGAGPTGLSAALAAARSGARVILADEDFVLGGQLLAETHEVNSQPGHQWAAETTAELSAMPNVRLMTRTTVYGAYDHGIYGALERKTDHLADSGGKPRHVLWRIYSKRAMVCAGALERSIAFGNNDRPGIMLASAVRAYTNRWAVTPGKSVAIFTNNDDAYRTAHDLAAAGVEVAAIIDTRADAQASAPTGVRHIKGAAVLDTMGRKGLSSVKLTNGDTLAVDCLAVSGGWNPNVHLACHQRSFPVWNDNLSAFVPGSTLPTGMHVAGAANGTLTLGAALREGHETAQSILTDLGVTGASTGAHATASDEPANVSPFWEVKESRARVFVDLQNDVTIKDVRQSHQEGFRSVEHLKRYTTLGMATDQGKTANVLGLAVLADASGKTIAETGTTIFRPPYSPVSLGALGGRSRGKNFRPTRLTPSHKWAEAQGAVFVETGAWLRAQWYPKNGETHWRESVDREVTQTRNAVGVCDVTTLGKIDIQGRDATEFINRVYANGFAKLAVGKVRYGLMLREDGLVMDDGTTARLGEHHYLMTTTTANAVSVFRHLEFCRQCLWPGLDVHLISVTEQWAQFAVAGPKSRELLAKVVDDVDLGNHAFPFMACAEITICGGVKARLFRISFSGELAYEIAVPARYGNSLMHVLMQAGEPLDVVAYGTEALGVMRVEKGHAAGNELSGQTTARDLGLGRMVSTKKDSIGAVLSRRPELNRDEGYALVGFRPVDLGQSLSGGAHFVTQGDEVTMQNDQGYMTSVAFSPTLGHSIGLGLIKRGNERMGEVVHAVNPLKGQTIDVEIVSPHFVDPKGERLRG